MGEHQDASRCGERDRDAPTARLRPIVPRLMTPKCAGVLCQLSGVAQRFFERDIARAYSHLISHEFLRRPRTARDDARHDGASARLD